MCERELTTEPSLGDLGRSWNPPSVGNRAIIENRKQWFPSMLPPGSSRCADPNKVPHQLD